MEYNKALEIVINTIKELNLNREANKQIVPHADTSLFGPLGVLDSLGLVELIVAIEDSVYKDLGIAISLANVKAISLKNSPFKSIQTLSLYLSDVVKEIQNGKI